MFSCSDDKTINAFKWHTVQQDGPHCSISQRYLGHGKAVNRIAVDGKRGFVWSVSRDLCIKQWKVDINSNSNNSSNSCGGGGAGAGECLQSIPDAAELNLSAIALDEEGDGCHVFVGSRDYSVKQYDVSTGKAVATFSSPRNVVTSLAVGSTGSSAGLVYQSSEDLRVRIWDPRSSSASKMPAGEITDFVYFALCMDLHPDGNLLATGCKGFNGVGCEVKIFDLRAVGKEKSPLHAFRGHSQDVTACKFLSSANSSGTSNNSDSSSGCGSSSLQAPLVSCCKDGSIRAWDVRQGLSADGAIDVLETQRNYTSLAPLWNASVSNIDSASASASASAGASASSHELHFSAGCFDGGTQLLSLRYDKARDRASIHVKHSTPSYTTEEGEDGGGMAGS